MANYTKVFALAGISILSFTGYLDATIVSTALPTIQSSLHMTVSELQWIMNAFFLGISAFMASMGRVADIYGRRKVFYIGAVIFGLASFGAGMATEAIWLIIFRAIQGIVVAITIPVGITLIQTIFSKSEAPKAMGIFGAITGAGLALGPVVGGALVTHFGWPSVFFVNIPFILVGLALCLFTLKESRSKTKMTLDYFGIIFMVLTIGSLVFAVVEINTYGLNSWLIKSSFIVFILSLVTLIFTEMNVKHPIMAAALFKNPVFIGSLFFIFVGGGLMSVILFIDPLYLSLVLNQTSWMTGVYLFIIPLTVMSLSPFIGYLNERIGPRKTMILGALFYLMTAIGQIYFSINLNYFLLIPTFIIFGMGWSIINQSPAVAIGQSISEDHLSVAIGVLFTFYNIGASVLLAVAVMLFHWQTKNHLLHDFSSSGMPLSEAQQQGLTDFISNPNTMNQIIQQLHLTQPNIQDIFKNAFMSGLHMMYMPLLALSVMALILVKYRMKSNCSSF